MTTGRNTVFSGLVDPTQTPVALATATTLTVSTHGNKILTNTGASATLEHALPAAAVAAGVKIAFYATVAQITRFQPASGESVFYGGDGVANKYLELAGVIGNMVELYCDGVQWIVENGNGVLTKEA